MIEDLQVFIWFKQKILGSIATKMGLVLLTMAAVFGLVVTVALDIFGQTEKSLASLATIRLPEISVNSSILSESNTLNSAVTSMLAARDVGQIEKAAGQAAGALDQLDMAVKQATSPEISGMALELNDIRSGIGETQSTLLSAFSAEAMLSERIAGLNAVSERFISFALKEIKAAENFQKTSVRRTQRNAAETINAFLEGDLGSIGLIYELKSAFGKLSGDAFARSQTTDIKLGAVLGEKLVEEIAAASQLVEQIEGGGANWSGLSIVKAEIERLERLTLNNVIDLQSFGARILNERQRIDEELDAVIQDLRTSAEEHANSAVEANNVNIDNLMGGAVARLSMLHNIESAVRQYVNGTLAIANSQSPEELETLQRHLGQLSQKLQLFAKRVVQKEMRKADIISQELLLLIEYGDSEVGIGREAEQVILTREQAARNSEQVRLVVDALLLRAYRAGEKVISTISDDTSALRTSTAGGRHELMSIAWFAAALLIASVLLTMRWVLLPIRKITLSTQRLSKGDLSEISGFHKTGGEILAMAHALQVFRDSLVSNKKRDAEESARLARELEDEKQRMYSEKEASERAEALERDRATQKERERVSREQDIEAARQQKEQQAKQLAEEQNVIVSNLAAGLKCLADGDLTVQIEVPFTEAYEPLRLDFNQTVRRLGEVISKIMASESSIHRAGLEMAQRTDLLTNRTQKTSQTLVDTAGSLREMTEQVEATSNRTSTALDWVKTTQECSDRGRQIVSATVDAMQEIEEFSKRVSQITAVIDEIAFQTNLLALNAGVEAARAGEAGRGFAVVANEVRELAQRSSNAAGEIYGLISGSKLKVDEGTRLVGETRQALEEIDSSVVGLANEAREIANTTNIQAKRIGDINQDIAKLDVLTKENAAMSQEMQQANQGMQAESSTLADSVAEFEITAVAKDVSRQTAA
ncbi:MAG: methyl-accepting chemotaxis protein [Paracoccaceae bacterium]